MTRTELRGVSARESVESTETKKSEESLIKLECLEGEKSIGVKREKKKKKKKDERMQKSKGSRAREKRVESTTCFLSCISHCIL